MIDFYFWTTPNGYKVLTFLEEPQVPWRRRIRWRRFERGPTVNPAGDGRPKRGAFPPRSARNSRAQRDRWTSAIAAAPVHGTAPAEFVARYSSSAPGMAGGARGA